MSGTTYFEHFVFILYSTLYDMVIVESTLHVRDYSCNIVLVCFDY